MSCGVGSPSGGNSFVSFGFASMSDIGHPSAIHYGFQNPTCLVEPDDRLVEMIVEVEIASVFGSWLPSVIYYGLTHPICRGVG